MSAVLAPTALPWRQYLCRVCGLVYDERLGDADSGLAAGTRFEDIPDDWACPICGVGKAEFERHTAAPVRTVAAAAAPRATRPAAQGREPGVVIVGAGRAGWQVAQALRAQHATLPITVLSACAGDVYDKPMLSVAVARGLDPAAMVRESAAVAAARLSVQLRSGTHAVGIDPVARRLRTTRGTLRYSHLVLAQGAEPVLPAVLPAALVWRVNDLAAYRRLRTALGSAPQRVAIVGAGLVGCELANDLALAGHRVTLIDLQPRPLALQLPAPASNCLLQAWGTLPIHFLGGVQVAGVQRPANGSAPLQVLLQQGRAIDADHVIAATGLRAAGRLAASAGLAFDSAAGGIAVDTVHGQTSQSGIYALGDCAVVDGRASRYIEPIARQAQGIAAHILGRAPAAGSAGAAAPSGNPVLRVKTSALPITVTGTPQDGGEWHIDEDGPQGLRMRRLDARGHVLASLTARPPAGARDAGPGTEGTGRRPGT